MTSPDVPAEVLAALHAADDLEPVGQPAAGDDSAAWWDAFAQADEVRAQAYERLGRWAAETRQPMAVVHAIDSARTRHERAAVGARNVATDRRASTKAAP